MLDWHLLVVEDSDFSWNCTQLWSTKSINTIWNIRMLILYTSAYIYIYIYIYIIFWHKFLSGYETKTLDDSIELLRHLMSIYCYQNFSIIW